MENVRILPIRSRMNSTIRGVSPTHYKYPNISSIFLVSNNRNCSLLRNILRFIEIAMDSFTSFSNSQSSSRNRWNYDTLKDLRQISPVVQNHIKRV